MGEKYFCINSHFLLEGICKIKKKKNPVNRFTGFTESYNKTVIDCLSKPLIRVWLTGECFYHCILGISFNKFLQSAGEHEIF